MGDEGWPDGRYVMAGAGAKTVAVISDPLDTVQPKPDQWLNKDFLTVEKPRTIAVQFPEATNSWKLDRASETNDWQFADAKAGEKLDSAKISSVTSPFSSASFNDVAAAPASAAASNTVLTVETFDGFTYTASIGPKQDDNYPVRFTITASLPAARTPAKDEKPEDKAKLDKEFQARQKTLADKLAKESASPTGFTKCRPTAWTNCSSRGNNCWWKPARTRRPPRRSDIRNTYGQDGGEVGWRLSRSDVGH